MADRPNLDPRWEELSQLYQQAQELLDGLDRLGLYQAGAHLSMAIETIRLSHPHLPSE
jgi:hypothetical protein